MKLSVVVPVYNEEGCLEEFIRRTVASVLTLGVEWELLLVDDGSRDRSPDIMRAAAAEHPGIVIPIVMPKNGGQHAALMRGFAAVRGEFVVTLDADLQNPPEEIPRVYAEWVRGADVVGTIRTPRNDSFLRRVASCAANVCVLLFCHGHSISDCGCMLRGFSRPVIDAMVARGGRPRFIPVFALKYAKSSVEIEVSHAPRTSGESKYGLWQLVKLMVNLLDTLILP